MNVFPSIYNTLSGWMSRYPFSSKPTPTKHAIRTWGHSGGDDSKFTAQPRSIDASHNDDLILAQMGMAWQQLQPQSQPQQHHRECGSKPAAPPSPAPSTSSAVSDEALVNEPWRSHHLFVECQDALVAAQRRFFRSVVRATEAHLDGRVNQDEVAMFGHFYPDARARLNQGFKGQNHLHLDEWDHSLKRAREQLANEAVEIMKKMQYLHVDAMLELIGRVDDLYDAGVGAAFAPVASSSSTSLPTPATSPEPSRKRGLDDSDDRIIDTKAAIASRPRPLKRARIEIIKTEDCDLAISPALTSSSSLSLSAATEALMGSSSLLTPPPPAPISPKRTSQTSAPRRRRRSTRSTRSGTKKSH